jgi:hypothetical protein
MRDQKLFLKGKQCCWRCGLSKRDVQLSGMVCYVGYQTYQRHLWKIKDEEKETIQSRVLTKLAN